MNIIFINKLIIISLKFNNIKNNFKNQNFLLL